MKEKHKCYYCDKKLPLVADDVIIVYNGKYFHYSCWREWIWRVKK